MTTSKQQYGYTVRTDKSDYGYGAYAHIELRVYKRDDYTRYTANGEEVSTTWEPMVTLRGQADKAVRENGNGAAYTGMIRLGYDNPDLDYNSRPRDADDFCAWYAVDVESIDVRGTENQIAAMAEFGALYTKAQRAIDKYNLGYKYQDGATVLVAAFNRLGLANLKYDDKIHKLRVAQDWEVATAVRNCK